MTVEIIVKSNERIEDLHRNNLRIIQNPKLFCFGQDAVLLSWFAKAGFNDNALDLCCGNGIVPILMSARNKCVRYDGLELLPESADLAKRSVRLNGLSDKIKITCGDLKNACDFYEAAAFDVITANPPYMRNDGGFVNESEPLAIARHEIACTIDDILTVSAKLLKFGGHFYMIHKPTRMVDVFCAMRAAKIEPKRVLTVHSQLGKEPAMFLVEGIFGGKPFLRTLPPLFIYENEANGVYTKEVMEIYYGK